MGWCGQKQEHQGTGLESTIDAAVVCRAFQALIKTGFLPWVENHWVVWAKKWHGLTYLWKNLSGYSVRTDCSEARIKLRGPYIGGC